MGHVREMSLSLTLDDASTVTVDDADVGELYDQLWLLAPRPGAVTAAAKVRHARLNLAGRRDPLNARESSALLAALDRLRERP